LEFAAGSDAVRDSVCVPADGTEEGRERAATGSADLPAKVRSAPNATSTNANDPKRIDEVSH